MKKAIQLILSILFYFLFVGCGSQGHNHSHDDGVIAKEVEKTKAKELQGVENSVIKNEHASYIKEWRVKNKEEITDKEFEEIVEQFKKEKNISGNSAQDQFNNFVDLWLKENQFKVKPMYHSHPH